MNEGKIKKIVREVERGVNLLKHSPIIVNEDMEIIDGQHRFMVSKSLGENVFYVILKEADLSIVPAINSNTTKWKASDFMGSFLDLKKQPYIELQEFCDRFPRVSLQTALKLFHTGTVSGHNALEAFCGGDLSSEYKDTAYELAQQLNTLSPYMSNAFSSRMFTVIKLLRHNGKYDHELMLRKLAESGKRIDELSTVKGIIINMEAIINHKAHTRIIIH